MTTRVRRVLWRTRHLVAALSLGSAAALSVATLAPAETAGEPVVTLTRNLPAGTVLTGSDLGLRRTDAGTAAGALADPAVAEGQTLAVALPAGTPLLSTMLTGPGLAENLAEGHVVVPVPIADSASAALAQPGRRVTLVAAGSDGSGDGGTAQVVAEDVVVLAAEQLEEGTMLDPAGNEITFVYVAAHDRFATVLVGAGAWAPLRVVLEPP